MLPILHLNGFKISERTVFGCMDDKELVALFSGYGYQVCIVEDLDHINDDLQNGMEWALAEIRKIQRAARSGQPIVKPRWPMLVLRTPKVSSFELLGNRPADLFSTNRNKTKKQQGWTGPKEVDGKLIEGSFHSHQVPLPKANADEGQLRVLEDWLSSYRIGELVRDGRPTDVVLRTLPGRDEKKLGQVRATYDAYVGLKPVDWRPFAAGAGRGGGGGLRSSMQAAGEFLDRVFRENGRAIRLFSPDELESNKLDAVLRHTGRNFQWDEWSRARGGRVVEVLSEHACQGFLQGYTLTGRTGVFPSYESFLGIVHTMMVQYAKFVKIAREVPWRGDLPSVNYIETSTWARQEHNGFSHQNPSFIGAVLNIKAEAARVSQRPSLDAHLI